MHQASPMNHTKNGGRTNYEKGRDFEYKVKRILEGLGYVVVRCAGSKPVDLVAMKPGVVVFVECKKGGRIDIAQKVYGSGLAKKAGARYIVVTPDNLREVMGKLKQEPPGARGGRVAGRRV